MDNDPVNPSRDNDEEYQFTDDEGAHKYESPAASTSPSSTIVDSGDKDGARRKKLILIIIGVIVGAFCLYKLYGLFTVAPSTPTTTLTAPATQKQTVPPPATAPISSAQPVLPPVLSEEKFDKEDLKNKISTLEQTVVQNGRTQDSLQSQIGGISSAITEIQSNIAMLTQQINAMAQQKSDSETKLKAEQAKAEASRKAEEAKKTAKRSSYRYSQSKNKRSNYYGGYYVRAMVQGRAWLVNSRGATLTVSTGDQLPGYGQIQEINPDKGIVATSSGRSINYMSRDR